MRMRGFIKSLRFACKAGNICTNTGTTDTALSKRQTLRNHSDSHKSHFSPQKGMKKTHNSRSKHYINHSHRVTDTSQSKQSPKTDKRRHKAGASRKHVFTNLARGCQPNSKYYGPNKQSLRAYEPNSAGSDDHISQINGII